MPTRYKGDSHIIIIIIIIFFFFFFFFSLYNGTYPLRGIGQGLRFVY